VVVVLRYLHSEAVVVERLLLITVQEEEAEEQVLLALLLRVMELLVVLVAILLFKVLPFLLLEVIHLEAVAELEAITMLVPLEVVPNSVEAVVVE